MSRRSKASRRKIAANQANAAKSTGPQTAAGKAASSRNAVKHGLTSKDLVIAPGQQEEFDQLAAGLQADLRPEGAAETVLFHQILTAVWRLLRCDRVEAELATRTTEPDPLLDPALQPTLRTLTAARAQALKQQRTATSELRTMQSERQYRAALVPENEPTDDNREYGLANLRTLLPRIRKQKMAEEDAELMAVINAPMPRSRYEDDPEYQELNRRAEAILAKTNPELVPGCRA